ncbi:hypothetical protein [Streptomyces sp. CBMA156]|uniref:hypothetical protein n=1 Tax=Streptomyces sp. CBMA156 TaxID=1930280 RepID=UPI001661AA9F|nr:hypothetical protein [Streptomyces sp. CBMA156]MBD0675173.1 hypothetical protein [Streptomyces sp. CBMA156]
MPTKRHALRGLTALLATGLAAVTLAAPSARADTVVADYASVTSTGSLGNYAAPNGPVTRSQAVARAKDWADKAVPYSPNGVASPYGWWADAATGGRYRQDCSGLISMAWQLNTSLTTDSLPGVATPISFSQLRPGDALNNKIEGHVVLFAGWINKSAGTFQFYAEHSRSRPTSLGTGDLSDPANSVDSHSVRNYQALRYNKITDDPVVPTTPVYSGDVPVAGRWPGSVSTTVGVFRDGTWALRNSNSTGPADGSVAFGQAGDVPIVGDWDGVGHTQLGVYRPSSSTFAVRHDDGSATSLVFGQAGDVPVPWNWDANGHAQMAIYRPSTNTFTVRHDDGSVSSVVLGQAGDVPVVGDWDGVGHAQMGIYRPSTSTFALRHDDGSVSTVVYGQSGDLPVTGDWNATGRTTYGIYRPSTGTFALSGASVGQADTVFDFGNGGTWS